MVTSSEVTNGCLHAEIWKKILAHGQILYRLNNWVAMSMLVQGPRETALSIADSYVKFEHFYCNLILSKPL